MFRCPIFIILAKRNTHYLAQITHTFYLCSASRQVSGGGAPLSDTEASKANIAEVVGIGRSGRRPATFSLKLAGSANHRSAMLHFSISYLDAYMRKQTSESIKVPSLESAMEVAVDYCLAHPTAWAAEIHNRAGFVLRINFAQVRKPIAELRSINLTKYSRPRRSMSHQLTLF